MQLTALLIGFIVSLKKKVMDNSVIYGLRCPINGEYKYIGKSTNGIRRAKQHLVMSHNPSVRIWVEELREIGMCPLVEIIEECEEKHINDREQFWVNYYHKNGNQLMNIVVYEGVEVYKIEKEIREKKEILNKKLSSINKTLHDISSFNGIIRHIRKERGITQQELSDLSGVSIRSIKIAESENGNPTLNTITKIGDALGVNLTFSLKEL